MKPAKPYAFIAAIALIAIVAGLVLVKKPKPQPASATIVQPGATAPAPATPSSAPMTRYNASSGSKMRIEGTSTLHDWQAVSPLILGFLEVGPNFPGESGQAAAPGKIEIRGEALVNASSLRSVKKDGTWYKDEMDDKMHELLKQTNFPKIVFRINELVLKEAPKDKVGPHVFDSKGDLAVAGVTNNVAFPVSVFVLPEKKLRITGVVPLKMTQFGINPSNILLKTGDDITIKFEWMVKQQGPAAAPAK